MKTNPSLIESAPTWFAVLSPIAGVVVGFLGAWSLANTELFTS